MRGLSEDKWVPFAVFMKFIIISCSDCIAEQRQTEKWAVLSVSGRHIHEHKRSYELEWHGMCYENISAWSVNNRTELDLIKFSFQIETDILWADVNSKNCKLRRIFIINNKITILYSLHRIARIWHA